MKQILIFSALLMTAIAHAEQSYIVKAVPITPTGRMVYVYEVECKCERQYYVQNSDYDEFAKKYAKESDKDKK